MIRALPKILELLRTRAEVPIRSVGDERGFALYEADLTEWNLRFSDRTPFIIIQEQDIHEHSAKVWDAVLELVVAHKWQDSLPVIIVEGRDDNLRQKVLHARETHFSMAILDDRVAESMSNARSCRYPMLDAVLTQVSRVDLLPYETAAPVTGSRFFNRQSEVRRLTGTESSYAITGVRRIGKTSLLQEAKRLMERKQNTLLLICSTIHSENEFMLEFIRTLRPEELRHVAHYLFNFSDFLKRMPKYMKGRITLFLDEADRLIEIDKKTGYKTLSALRDARTATNGGWRFIFAGATELENECLNRTSPLFNMVQSMPLGPFNRRQAEAVIVKPFDAVRITIKNATELVDRIYRETGGHPNLIQHYCVLLASLVDQQGRDFIEVGDLNQVYTSRAFRDYVLRSFEINSGPMERLIVYLMANQDDFTQQQIDIALKKHKVVVPFMPIDVACANLEKVAVLRKTGRTYQFALHLLPGMLQQNYDLDYLITKAREELRR